MLETIASAPALVNPAADFLLDLDPITLDAANWDAQLADEAEDAHYDSLARESEEFDRYMSGCYAW